MSRSVLLLMVLLAPASLLAAPEVVFHGNEALIDPVLLLAMDLPTSAGASRTMADLGAANLRRFLRRTGYDLAQVQVVAEGGVLHAFLDEGKLERVVVHGQSSWRTVQVKLALRLPADVFNRVQLDREAARLKTSFGLVDLRWAVRDSGATYGVTLQLGQFESLPVELLWTREPSRYELHLFTESGDWGDGWGVGLALESPDGLRVDVSWSDDALFFADDRYRLDSLAGAWLREPMGGGTLRPVLTRAAQSVRWLTPPLVGDWLRLDVQAVASVRNVQRADLHVDAAWRYGLEAAAGASFELFRVLEATASAGYRQDGVAQVATVPGGPALGDDGRGDPFVRLVLGVTRPDPSLRLDRRLVARLVAEDDGAFRDGHATRLLFDASGSLERAWNELYLGLRGAWVGGPGAAWWDDVDLTSCAFRIPPPGLAYARRLAQVGLEGRLSLHRDFFKVGAFLDGSVHETGAVADLDSTRGLAAAFGLSVHFLVLDAFEFDAYLGGVVDQELDLGQGAMILFRKVY